MRYLLFISLFVGLALWLPASEPAEQFGVFHPDRPDAPGRIVLRGPDATIVLDANSNPPGIFVISGDSTAAVYIRNGRPVVGIRSTKTPNAPAVLFADERGNGYLQLRERGGAHVLRPSEIVK